MLGRADRDAAVNDSVRRARASMQMGQIGQVQVGDYVIDLTDDIQQLTEVLVILGYGGSGE